MMKLASKDWANWKIIFAVHNNGKKHKWFMLHIDCFDKWINSIKKNILKTKDNMSWGDFVEIKKYSYMIKKGVDRAIREENTTVVEEHFEGEELVGRVVYETDKEEIDESKDVVKRDTLEEDEEHRDGGVKRHPIEEKEEKMKAEGVKMQEIVSYPFYFEDEIVITFVYEGRPCWIAKDIGNILGYARDGGSLIHIIKDWSRSKNDFINKGDDYVILTGEELKQFKDTTRAVSSYSARLMLIFKGGLELVCDRQNNSVGRKLKEFLIEEVLPRIGKSEEKKIEKKIEKDTEEEKIEAITTSCKEEGIDIVPVKEKTYQVVDVDFYGGTIEAVLDENGDIWASVRRACEHIGIDEEGQRQKLRNPNRAPWSTACVIKAVAEDGKIREQFMLHLDSVPMWLATIDAGRVRHECRELLVMYQKEAAKVLRDHFFGKQKQQVSIEDIIEDISKKQLAKMIIESEEAREKSDKEVLRLEGKIEKDREYTQYGEFASAQGCIKPALFVRKGDGLERVLHMTFGPRTFMEYLHRRGFIMKRSYGNGMKWTFKEEFHDWFVMLPDPISKKGDELHITSTGQRKIVDYMLKDPYVRFWSREYRKIDAKNRAFYDGNDPYGDRQLKLIGEDDE
jgi:prophage antirepressor-like protein